jgi:hypothetical protein
MSENNPQEQRTESEGRLSQQDFARVIGEDLRLKGLQQDYGQQRAQHLRTSYERYSLNKAAYGVVAKGNAMDTDKEREFIRSCIQLWETGGKFQSDLFPEFDDLRTLIKRIHDRMFGVAEEPVEEKNKRRLKGIKALDSLTSAA